MRYLQHPQYKTLQDEAAAVFSGKAEPSQQVGWFSQPAPNPLSEHSVRLDGAVVDKVEQKVLEFVRKVLKIPSLQLTDKPGDFGATSMSAMALVGGLRAVVEACNVAVRSLKVAIIKELLWGTVRAMVQALLSIDDHWFVLPCDDGLLDVSLVIQYCGG